MTLKILTHGIADPDSPVELKLEYPEGVREVAVQAEIDPWNPQRRIIGISSPMLAKLGDDPTALEDTPAAAAFSADDAGADIIAVDGEELQVNPVLGVTLNDRVANRMVTHADKPVTLTLRRQDEAKTVTEVTIEPRKMKTLGFELSVGPVNALVQDGPAAKAGVQVGDRILAIEGIEALSAMQLPSQIRKLDGPVKLTLQRTGADEPLEVEIEPVADHSPLPMGCPGDSTRWLPMLASQSQCLA